MTSSPDNTVEKILSKFVGCKLPHPKYMTCEWCDELPEAKQSLDSHYLSIFLELVGDYIKLEPYPSNSNVNTKIRGINQFKKSLRAALQDRLGGKK